MHEGSESILGETVILGMGQELQGQSGNLFMTIKSMKLLKGMLKNKSKQTPGKDFKEVSTFKLGKI